MYKTYVNLNLLRVNDYDYLIPTESARTLKNAAESVMNCIEANNFSDNDIWDVSITKFQKSWNLRVKTVTITYGEKTLKAALDTVMDYIEAHNLTKRIYDITVYSESNIGWAGNISIK